MAEQMKFAKARMKSTVRNKARAYVRNEKKVEAAPAAFQPRVHAGEWADVCRIDQV